MGKTKTLGSYRIGTVIKTDGYPCLNYPSGILIILELVGLCVVAVGWQNLQSFSSSHFLKIYIYILIYVYFKSILANIIIFVALVYWPVEDHQIFYLWLKATTFLKWVISRKVYLFQILNFNMRPKVVFSFDCWIPVYKCKI